MTPAALLAMTLTACGGGEDDKSQTVTVLAAASLTKTFTEIGAEFEKQHEGVNVEFSFGGSSDLVTQILDGAPAQVFASADSANMGKLTDVQSIDFATNTLTIAVPLENPAQVDELSDLTEASTRVVICAPQVPCGAATVKVEEVAGLDIGAVSEEQSVTDVLAKVTSGEADAGLVYVTDVQTGDETVRGIAFPEAAAAVNIYPIAALTDDELAQAFVDLVLSAQGQQILTEAGFGRP